MTLSEFDLIKRYFSGGLYQREDVTLGIGDDCALLQVPAGQELAVTIDTLVEGVHFFPGADPEALGHKALAVSLSDLAAMGATPAWATLALTLPRSDSDWLQAFSRGLGNISRRYQVQLIGGDTTRGSLSITLQLQGFVEPGRALRRNGARVGDLIGVTGTVGDAGLALLALQGRYDAGDALGWVRDRLERPQPRVAAGRALVGLARAAIDISDGLLADLGHICERSGTGATLHLEQLPLSPPVVRYLGEKGDWSMPLSAGDDYELCFSVPPRVQRAVERAIRDTGCAVSWVGVIDPDPGIRCLLPGGTALAVDAGGYEHFC
jgi:thiamine-monophosphate kinase